MIHIERLHRGDIFIVTLDGPLKKEDFEQLAQELDPIIASQGKLTGLMIYVQSFPGWQSFGAFVEHFAFVRSHHRRIERIAAVTDSKLLKPIPHIAGLFVAPKITTFNSEQKDLALKWLETGG